jgi:topoisomerase IV subunit A
MNEPTNKDNETGAKSITQVSELYKDWFLDYASYVILERAVPALEDGLKPVQRRILHALKEMDDGRFHKVANVIGNTMQYHPHGDAAIGDALVHMGQKDLLIDTQGNWGDIITGDAAAAPRYIEARLSKFALEVCFSPEVTQWQLTYDGRKKEPLLLPVKFPLLLAQGAEGIAVGLSTRILPHNFIELIEASIDIIKDKEVNIIPDFPTGGMADFSNYNRGERGSRVRIRSKIEILDKKTLAIRSIPFSATTTRLIDSIVKANDMGKIKIKQVIDNTAKEIEILIELHKGVSPDVTIDALYAFTLCEISISPNACVILNDSPVFLNVNEMLRLSTLNTRHILRKELEVRKKNLSEKWHFASLEKIFIEKRIYRKIETCETWEAVIETIDTGLKPYVKYFHRAVTRDDIIRLTEIKIKRISKYDSFKADEHILYLEKEMEEVENHLNNLNDYTISYFKALLKKYGKGRERKTEIRTFDTIEARNVAAANKKLYVNRKEGFVGFGLKKEECIGECSDLDDIIAFRKDGKFMISKVDEKTFMGKDIIHVGVFEKENERMTYNMVYLDGKSKKSMVKRFNIGAFTRDKEYDITKGSEGSRILYFTVNPLGETEIVNVALSQSCKARIKSFDFDFADIAIKSRNAQGNILTRYPVRKITQKSVNTSNVLGIDFYFDPYIGRLNTRETGDYVGNFLPEDLILAIYKDGSYTLTHADISNHYDIEKLLRLEKYQEDIVITALYYYGKNKAYMVKRFQIETTSINKAFQFIDESPGSKLILASTGLNTLVKFLEIKNKKGDKKEEQLFDLSEFIEIRGWKSVGNKLSPYEVKNIKIVDIIYKEKESIKNEEKPESEKPKKIIMNSEQLKLF